MRVVQQLGRGNLLQLKVSGDAAWSQVVESAIRIVFAFSAVALVSAQVATFCEATRHSFFDVTALCVLAGSTVGLAALMLLGRETNGLGVGILVLICLLYLGLGVVDGPVAPAASAWWALVSAPVVVVFIALSMQGRYVAIAVVAYAGVYAIATLLHSAQIEARSLMLSVGVVIAGAAAIRPTADRLREGAKVTDRQIAIRRRQMRAEAELAALAHQTRWVDRMLHDDLVHALRAVSLAGAVPPAEVRSLAGAAVTRLAASAHAVDEQSSVPLADRLDEIACRAGLDLTVTAEPVAVPSEVAQAMTYAVRESLRNVRLHSGVEAAEVRVVTSGRGAVVQVEDHGCGFDPEASTPGHVGVCASMRQRMHDVGGSCDIRSGPDGTIVTLSWQPASRAAGVPVRRTQLAGVQRAVAAGGSAFVLLDVVQAVVKFRMLPSPWPATVGTVILLVAWLGALPMLLHGRVTSAGAALLSSVAVLCIVVGGCSLPAWSLDGTDYWLACGVAPLLLVQIILRPMRESCWAAAAAVIAPIGVVVMQGGGAERLIALGPAVLAPAYVLGAAYLMAWLVDRLARRAELEWERSLRSARRVAELRERERVMVARLSGLRHEVRPFLEEIASGAADLRHHAVVQRATYFEAQVRDQIGGRAEHISGTVADLVSELRINGLMVGMSVDTELDEHETRLVARALRGLRCCPGGRRVTLRARDIGSCRLVSVVITAYEPKVLALWSPLALADETVEVTTDHTSFISWRYRSRTVTPDNSAGATSDAADTASEAATDVDLSRV